MKATPCHHSNKLSSSVAFNAEEDGRRTKKTYIVLSSWLVLHCSKCRLPNGLKSGWPTLPLCREFATCRSAAHLPAKGGKRPE